MHFQEQRPRGPRSRAARLRLRTPLLSILLVIGCGGDDGGPSAPTDGGPAAQARTEAVASLASEVIVPAYRDFAAAAAELETATATWRDSGSEDDRAAAQEAWRRAIDLWQRAEVMQVGPAGAMDVTVGGEDLRDAIYSWPIVNRCRVDQELVEEAYVDVDAFAAENVNVRGLDAMEPLLFVEGEGNGCAPNSSINRDGLWAPIVSELPARRAAYAATAAALVRRDADALLARWEGGFLAEMTEGGELFPTAQEALNALSDAMFYLDKETKDMKLAEPAGLSDVCVAEVCPELRESLYANRSIEHVANNLRGFRAVFTGSETGTGFDDLLVLNGAETLATDMLAAIDAALATADAIEGDVPTALAADPDALMPLYEAIRALTDLLKTQFLGVLDLELPQRAEG
ncbi:MAG TPA: imelysin family protein, partial [Polyangiaceae bacterium LLY-WYZ-15_(1-7)]|nr:imelysin family protein [Polyangiaceae bacterium LLY-WYZ-15_(1-7)]